MGEFASKGVGTAGLTTGIIGTTLGALNSGLVGNVLGGLGNNTQPRWNAELQYVSQLQAENAMLKSENYADKVGKETYMQSLADNRRLEERVNSLLAPVASTVADLQKQVAVSQANLQCCCEKQELREQIVVGKINEVALATKGRLDALDNTIACLSGKVNNITHTVVPISAVCPQPMPQYNSWKDPSTTTGSGGAA